MDVMKALGVLAIVLAHSGPPPVVVEMVSTYYIAIFLFVSGYFYKEAYSDDLRLLATRRLKALYIPFVAWNLGYLALHNVFFRLNIYSSKVGYLEQVSHLLSVRNTVGAALRTLTLTATEQMAGALWFLITLITVTSVFGVTSWLCRRAAGKYAEYARAAAVLAIFAVGYANQTLITWPAFINTSLVGVLIFYGGFLFKRVESRLPLNAILAATAALIVFLGRGTVVMGANHYRGPLILVVVVAAGVYANLYVATRLQDVAILNYLGRNTIFVVATHFLAFKLVSTVMISTQSLPPYCLAKFPVITGDGGWWIAYFACGVLVPLGIKYVIDVVRSHGTRVLSRHVDAEESGI